MSKVPKKEEQLVMESLRSQGFKNLDYEPITNEPPDILIDGEIAVEVRRLNQNNLVQGKSVGLEQDYNTTVNAIHRILSQLESNKYEESLNYSIKIRRPIPPKKTVQRVIKKAFKSVRFEKQDISIKKSILIELFPSGQKLNSRFEFFSSSDLDAGGIVVNETVKNVNLIIEEKSAKIKKNKSRYGIWWLALVDTIGYNLSVTEIAEINKRMTTFGEFDKILLISRLDKNEYNYLEKNNAL